jgi:hypothetical protein
MNAVIVDWYCNSSRKSSKVLFILKKEGKCKNLVYDVGTIGKIKRRNIVMAMLPCSSNT